MWKYGCVWWKATCLNYPKKQHSKIFIHGSVEQKQEVQQNTGLSFPPQSSTAKQEELHCVHRALSESDVLYSALFVFGKKYLPKGIDFYNPD